MEDKLLTELTETVAVVKLQTITINELLEICTMLTKRVVALEGMVNSKPLSASASNK